MREIKFRVWDSFQKRLVINGVDDYLSIEDNGELNNYSLLDTNIIMQYTGLKDKNGVEIYEGDIVEFYMIGSYCDDLSNAVVEFKEGSFTNCVFWNGCNVIGNIYENPKLLQ